MRKVFRIILGFLLVLGLAACNTDSRVSIPVASSGVSGPVGPATGLESPEARTQEEEPPMIGVSWPTKFFNNQNYLINCYDFMEILLLEKGYRVNMQFAGDNEVPLQLSQIENMITEGCKVIIILAIDGDSLVDVLEKAKAKNISVIALDRLITGTDAVDYYLTFNNWNVGVMQGQYIADELNLKSGGGPYNIELFVGDPGDKNSHSFFDGAMSVLRPYIDNGKLIVRSGVTEETACSIEGWKSENAQTRMEQLIIQNDYRPGGIQLHAILSPYDSLAQGITLALCDAGFTSDDFPILTGQGCNNISIINMRKGLQSMSVYTDTLRLEERVVKMVESIIKGEEPEINDISTFDNGFGKIPTFLCEPEIVTLKNIEYVLIDENYWANTEDRDWGPYKWNDIGGEPGELPMDDPNWKGYISWSDRYVDKYQIGVFLSSKSQGYPDPSFYIFKDILEASGNTFYVDSSWSGWPVENRNRDINSIITGASKVMVIGASETDGLAGTLAAAEEKGLVVIAYDRLIKDSDAIDFYATHDYYVAGVQQGQYIVDALNLEENDGSFNIELFTGFSDDTNIDILYDGAMSVIRPYIDNGKLVIRSGETGLDECATENWMKGPEENWAEPEARKRMKRLIEKYNYQPGRTPLDAVLCMNDSVAQCVSEALLSAGFTPDNFPIITGMGCEKQSLINMRSGTQSMSVFKDEFQLAKQTVIMAKKIINGESPDISDTKTFNNVTGVIPTFLCEPKVVTIENMKPVLIDVEPYYNWDEIGGPLGSLPLDELTY